MNATNALTLATGLAAGLVGYRRLFGRDDLGGKTVLITGGSKGLGFVLARDFARRGCPVAICARDQEELDIARRRLEDDEGATVVTGVCDFADQLQVDQFVSRVTEELGPVDILINNAGIIQVGPMDELEVDDFELAMDTMLWGVLHTTRAVLPQMMARGEGRVVNITSIGGKISVPHLLPYCCAKFAAVGFSEGLAAELSGSGVDIVTIAPGLMPGTTTKILGLVNRVLLPRPLGEPRQAEPGSTVYDALDDDARSVIDTFAALGQQATRQFQNLAR